jgi:hypothetical protein
MAIDLVLGKTKRSWGRGELPGGIGSDPLVWTPSAVRAELSRVRDVIDTINQEMSKALTDKKLSDVEWGSWFRTYQTAHKLVNKGSSLWGSNVAAARRHELEALRWRDLLQSRGAVLIGPKTMGQPPRGGSSLALLFPVLTGSLAAGGILYLGHLWNKKKT